MKNVKKLQEELDKELENKKSLDVKIANLKHQLEQEKRSKKLPKNIEKSFRSALESSQKEMQVLRNEIYKKHSEMDELALRVANEAENIAEKFGVPVFYSISDTEYSYGPESYQDKWSKYEEELKNEIGFWPLKQGWSSSSC
jgi:cell division septum initiation protein DivIVA